MQEKFYQEDEAFIALQNGEEKGLLHYFNRYYTPLVFYSYSFIKSYEAAHEIASEAFHKLWVNRNNLGEVGKVKAYLYRIASNAGIDYLRHQKTEQKRAARLHVISETFERSILEKMIEAETLDQLYSALKNLPPRPRQIFQLFYFEEKSIAEIAAILGVSADAVKSQKKRVLQLLRESQTSFYTLLLLLFVLFW